MNTDKDDVQKLADAIAFAEAVSPLPRCRHGKALRDGAGEQLEPPCGCRANPTSQQPISEAPEMHERVWISHRAFYLTEPPIRTDPGKGTYYHRDDLCVSRAGTEDALCPFCGEGGFDLIGLKSHLSGDCEPFEAIESVRRMRF